jgi:hypothetical protein
MIERMLSVALCVWMASASLAAASIQTKAPEALRQNIGKAACNATNGVYRGRIVDVAYYSPPGQGASWVYVVEREGRRQNAPPDNTTVADRCPDGQPTGSAPAVQGRTAPAAGPPVISPAMQKVATEFSGRLVAYKGQLTELSLSSRIVARWTSQRCEMTEGEVIDFLISLHRGHPGPINANIEATRECGGKSRLFKTTGARFQLYRTGKINDPEILKGLS